MSKLDRASYFPGANFLHAGDIRTGTKYTILQFEEIKTRLGLRPCLRFKETDKPFGLNATNFDTILFMLGEDADKWKGKKVRLITVKANNPSTGKLQDAIRIA